MRDHKINPYIVAGFVYCFALTVGLGIVTLRSQVAIDTAKTTALTVANQAKYEAERSAEIARTTECRILNDLVANAEKRAAIEGETQFPTIEGQIREKRVSLSKRAIARFKKVRPDCNK